MEGNVETVVFNSKGLLTVLHSPRGDAENGKEICDRIRKRIADSGMSICIFHDATVMETANGAYAEAFKNLDKEISGRIAEIVCSIPRSIPRMMARTVAMFSQKKWSIFKERSEAEKYLKSRGYA